MSQLGDQLGGMSIGDFAMNLIESGAVDKKPTPSKKSPTGQTLPQTDVDISDTEVPAHMMANIMEGSFGVPVQEVEEEPVQVEEEVVEETTSLREEVQSLREELASTISQFTTVIARMLELTEDMVGGVTTTQSFAPNYAGGKNKNRKKDK